LPSTGSSNEFSSPEQGGQGERQNDTVVTLRRNRMMGRFGCRDSFVKLHKKRGGKLLGRGWRKFMTALDTHVKKGLLDKSNQGGYIWKEGREGDQRRATTYPARVVLTRLKLEKENPKLIGPGNGCGRRAENRVTMVRAKVGESGKFTPASHLGTKRQNLVRLRQRSVKKTRVPLILAVRCEICTQGKTRQ